MSKSKKLMNNQHNIKKREILFSKSLKYCKKCNSIKSLNLFNKDKQKVYGLSSTCKKCKKETSNKYYYSQEGLESRNRYYNKKTLNGGWKENNLKRYGINLNQFNKMIIKQNNVCAICNMPETSKEKRTGKIKTLVVDHCHTTKKIRGLLCSNCNKGIGLLKDNKTILINAINYLGKNGN